MKHKIICLFTVCLLLFSCSGAAFASTNQVTKDIGIILDGKTLEMESAPIIQNGRTLVPMRAIFEAMGAKVEWDGKSQMPDATRGLKRIQMHLDWDCLYVNNVFVKLDATPELINNTTYVPVRAIAEGLDATVDWIDGNVVITSNTTGYAEYPSVPDFGKMFNCQEMKYQIYQNGEGTTAWSHYSHYSHYYNNADSSAASLTAYSNKLVELGYVQTETKIKDGVAAMAYTNAEDGSNVIMAKVPNSVCVIDIAVPLSLNLLNLKAVN